MESSNVNSFLCSSIISVLFPINLQVAQEGFLLILEEILYKKSIQALKDSEFYLVRIVHL